MSNLNTPQNPFNLEDWFAKVVWRDPSVQNSAKSSYYKFSLNHSKANIFMSLKFSILKSFSQHAVLASLVAFTLIGGVAVGATELLAPSEYKLSTFIKKYSQNQQTQKDPFTALAPDNDNYVVSVPDCNLALKYPKKVGGFKTDTNVTTYNLTENTENTQEYISSVSQFRLGIDYNPVLDAQKNYDITGYCFKKSDYSKLPKKTNVKNQLTKEQFFKETGWFIFEAEITNFEDITFNDEINSQSYNRYEYLLSRQVKFEFQDLVYEVSYTPRNLTETDFDLADKNLLQEYKDRGQLDVQGIFGNQIQLQFNSIVTNTFSSDIATSNSSSSTKSTASSDSKVDLDKVINRLPKELEAVITAQTNISSPIRIIDGKTYWIEPLTGPKNCNQSSDYQNCGNNKLMTLENGKAKTLLEFTGSEISSLQFLSSQSVNGQLYIYGCGGFGGGCRVNPGILFNPANGQVTKDDKWEYNESDSFSIWSKDSISSKIAAKDYPLYTSKKAWPTVFANEKYFGIKNNLQYARVAKTVEFTQDGDSKPSEYWIAVNNGKELTYLFPTALSGTNYEGIYLDTLKINSRGNLVIESKNDSYVDTNGRTILVENYTFIEQDLNSGKVIQKSEGVLVANQIETAKKYQ